MVIINLMKRYFLDFDDERMKIYENIWIRDDISDSKHIISNSASGLQLHFFVYIQLSSIPQWIFRQYQVSI